MEEHLTVIDRLRHIAGAGLVGLALSACVAPPSSEYEAYYTAFTDTIVYKNGSENNPATVRHEETHQRRARSMGRIEWGLRYSYDPSFACEEEAHAALAEGRADIFNHEACKQLKK